MIHCGKTTKLKCQSAMHTVIAMASIYRMLCIHMIPTAENVAGKIDTCIHILKLIITIMYIYAHIYLVHRHSIVHI